MPAKHPDAQKPADAHPPVSFYTFPAAFSAARLNPPATPFPRRPILHIHKNFLDLPPPKP
jgi:hypothetical protein